MDNKIYLKNKNVHILISYSLLTISLISLFFVGVVFLALACLSIVLSAVIIKLTMKKRERSSKLRKVRREGKIAVVVFVYSICIFIFTPTIVHTYNEEYLHELQGIVSFLNDEGYDISLRAEDVQQFIERNNAIKDHVGEKELFKGVAFSFNMQSVDELRERSFDLLLEMSNSVKPFFEQYYSKMPEGKNIVQADFSYSLPKDILSLMGAYKIVAVILFFISLYVMYFSRRVTERDLLDCSME